LEQCVLTPTYRAGEGDDENPLAALKTNHLIEENGEIKWTHEEAERQGKHWYRDLLEQFESGVVEKHISRNEAKFIRKDGSFPKFIRDNILPLWEHFKGCSFEAIQSLYERSIQMRRSKMHDLRRQDDEMWGPKKALDKKQIEDRMKASIWQLLDEVSVSEEDNAASWETGFSTEPQSRHVDE
jgi:hypothetical protein